MSDISCASFSGVFTPEELDAIRLRGESTREQLAEVLNASGSHRACSVAWMKAEGWLGEKLATLVRDINAHLFGYELEDGFREPLQYTVYREGEFYGWHMDKGPKIAATRKLSLTIQLSQPDEYDGGEFQVNAGSEVQTMGKEYGSVFAFPSYILHRVAPLSRGTRRALVVWCHGTEPFR